MPRLFVAVWPPADVVELVAALPRPSVAGLRWTTCEQWHVTLRFLGRVDAVEAVSGALRTVGPPAVEASLGAAVGRFDQRVLHVPVGGLGELATVVRDATATLGEPPEDRPFAGHLTLARVGKRGGGIDLRPLAGAPIAARWMVEEVTVVESRLSPAGATYSVVDRIPLRRAASPS